MSFEKKTCLAYGLILLAVSAINYIPGLTDPDGLAFGIFNLDIFDDMLHLASAIWAFAAAMISLRSARIFLILFGAAYLGDGVFGIFTGWGYLDLGIFTNESLGFSLSFLRIAANLPHIALGAVALAAGLISLRRA
ncbi:MAG: hypothetical protein ACXIVD_12055 [Salinarimonas sp.]